MNTDITRVATVLYGVLHASALNVIYHRVCYKNHM
jgi:hypothetical protein